ncbi:MAG: radical SAM protein [Desulfosalsimonadaceae bacterium]
MAGQKSIILIHPPVCVAAGAPAGVARLAGYLRAAGVYCTVIDLNIEAIMHLAARELSANDTWTRRAAARADKNLAALRSPRLYADVDRYKRAVADINRILHMAGREKGVHLSLSNYGEDRRQPVRSRDLASAANDFKDNLFYPFFKKRLAEAFAPRMPDIVGISVNFMSQAICASAIAGFIRRRFPAARIVFGGSLVTSWMKIPGVSNPLQGIADDMIPGPGELPLGAMCGALPRSLQPEDASTGVPYDFASLDPDRYLSPLRVLSVSASQGCYWRRCAFCPESAERNPYRPYRPETVAGILNGPAVHEPGGALVHFTDNALSPRFMKYLTDHPPGLPWYGFARITRHLADTGFVEGLAASGCVMLQLGIESGDQTVLDAMGKGTTVAAMSKALATVKAAGISVYGYLLFGTPPENEKCAMKTKAFVLAHAGYIDFLNLAVFNLPAQARLAKSLETRPFYHGDLSLYREFVHPLGWDRHRVRVFLEKSFKADATIRKIVNSDPPFFTSSHAPFFQLFSSDAG